MTVLPKRDLLSLSNLKHTLLEKKEKKKKKFQPAVYSIAAGILLLLLLLQITCTCKNYAGNFIPDLHTLLAALSIQYSLFILLCLCFRLQVIYLKARAMNMRMLFLKIISNTSQILYLTPFCL